MKKKCGYLLSVILIIFLLIGIPLIISDSYKQNSGYITPWGAETVLSYYGGCLSAVGSAVLGLVAILQNTKAHELNERATQLSKQALELSRKEHELNEQMQMFQQANFMSMVTAQVDHIAKVSKNTSKIYSKQEKDIAFFDVSDDTYSGEAFLTVVKIHNDSNYPIVDLTIAPSEYFREKKGVYQVCNSLFSSIDIPSHQNKCLALAIPTKGIGQDPDKGFMLDIGFTNIFDYTTNSSLKITNFNNSAYWFRLNKIVDVRPRNE